MQMKLQPHTAEQNFLVSECKPTIGFITSLSLSNQRKTDGAAAKKEMECLM